MLPFLTVAVLRPALHSVRVKTWARACNAQAEVMQKVLTDGQVAALKLGVGADNLALLRQRLQDVMAVRLHPLTRLAPW